MQLPVKRRAGNNVAPLVASANLENAAVAFIEMDEVEGLHQHVPHLQKREAALLEPIGIGFGGKHGIHVEVDAHQTHEIHVAVLFHPICVVQYHGWILALRADKALDQLPDFLKTMLYLLA